MFTYDKNHTMVLQKIKIKGIGDFKNFFRITPQGAQFGVFGMQSVDKREFPKPKSSIVITEGEYDAMSVY